MGAAISSGEPERAMGTVGTMRATRPGSPEAACMSVSIIPGSTALTRMPSRATSLASPIVSVLMAALEAA